VNQPDLHGWSEKDEPLRFQEPSKNKDDPEALAWIWVDMMLKDVIIGCGRATRSSGF
jgi:hypothetical protein